MLPREPVRNPGLGYLYIPPFRVQGISVAGEQSVVQVPELDVTFDIGSCPKAVLASPIVALTHGHMDHAAGLAYYFSQRNFQGMGPGTVVCHPDLRQPLDNVMQAWVGVEAQRTPYELIALDHDEQHLIKPAHLLRAFHTNHTVPSMGYVVVESRSKLRDEFVGLPQEKLKQLKQDGTEITRRLEVPLVCYTGDTAWGKHFERDDVLHAKVLITECTFLEPGHRSRANVGKHLHLNHILQLLEASTAEAIVLTHLSRRTNMRDVRAAIAKAVPEDQQERLLLLMDHRTNRQRFERQLAEAEAAENT
ncbi:MAG: MBL fold metallo-hydrolase [Planctomycetota bacterium]